MDKNQLTTAPVGSDIINEEFFNTDGLPQWMIDLKTKNSPCKALYYMLLMLLLR